MEFTQSVSYPGTVEEVVAMYLTPDYQQRRFGSFVVEGSESVAVEGERITFSGTARPELLPPPRRALSRARCTSLSPRSGRGTRPGLVLAHA